MVDFPSAYSFSASFSSSFPSAFDDAFIMTMMLTLATLDHGVEFNRNDLKVLSHNP